MRINYIGTLVALLTLLSSILGFRWHQQRLTALVPPDVQIESLPYQLGEWKGEDTEGLDLRSREILRLDRFVKRLYKNDSGDSLLLYLGYWKEQSGEYQAAKHSPALCLPSNGWHVRPQEGISLSTQGLESNPPLNTKRLIGEYRDREWLFYYWFFTGQTDYTQEWRALLTISTQSLLTGRTDGGIVEISIPLVGNKSYEENLNQKEALVKDFLQVFYPELKRLISQAS